MDKASIQMFIAKYVLLNITDKTTQYIIRDIIFNQNNSIDWNAALNSTLAFMPELKTIVNK